MFVSSVGLLRRARKNGYALPGFNASNLEVARALFEAAEESNAPLLIQTTESAIKYAGLRNIFAMFSAMERDSGIPVCLHLDHGRDLKLIKKCLRIGYKSIMVDASSFSFEDNIALTKRVVAMAARKGASVEAELGTLGGMGEAELTEPSEARLFVEKAGCDALAVAIGTKHGAYKFEGSPKIDLGRLKEISEAVSVPLVLHGASTVPKRIVNRANIFGARLKHARGVPERQLRKAVRLGISKVNTDTDLRLAFTASLREYLCKNPAVFDPRKYLSAGKEGVKEIALEKITLLGCRGKACAR
jgi:fructose-bisphosphate aldolase class II